MLEKYVLDENRNLKRSHNLMDWARWFEDAGEQRRVACDFFWDCDVSTVFLSTNHNFGDSGPPLLFETRVFGGSDEEDYDCWRWETWSAAEAGHVVVCKTLRERRPRWMRWAGWTQKFLWRFLRYEWDWATWRWEVK